MQLKNVLIPDPDDRPLNPLPIARPNDFALQTCVFFYAVALPPPSFLSLLPVNSSSCGCFNLLKQPKKLTTPFNKEQQMTAQADGLYMTLAVT